MAPEGYGCCYPETIIEPKKKTHLVSLFYAFFLQNEKNSENKLKM